MWYIQRMMMGGQVERYHTWPMPNQSVGIHSYGVAMIVQRLWPDCRKELVLAALQHDLGEQEVGDVPSPAKWRAREFFNQLNIAEACARTGMGFAGYEEQLTEDEVRVLKLADILELCAFARYALNCGHTSAQIVWENGQNYTAKLLSEAPDDAPGVREACALFEEILMWLMLKRAETMGEPKSSLLNLKGTPEGTLRPGRVYAGGTDDTYEPPDKD